MKNLETKTLLETIREATIFDLFIISIFLLPFFLSSWLALFDEWLNIDPKNKNPLALLLFICYLIGIFLMKIGIRKVEKYEKAGKRIQNYLLARNKTAMSFDRTRKVIQKSYTDTFLLSVIDHFPEDLRIARIKGGKQGIGLISEQEETAKE